MIATDAQAVLDFWFGATARSFWFAKSDEFDKLLTDKFLAILQSASLGECDTWRTTAQGRLAEIIVLDQFSRNIYRNTPNAFAADGMALALAQELIKQPDFAALTVAERNFALLPFMHSESKIVHEKAVPLFEKFSDSNTLDFELKHKAIIDTFGRYPHRNAILGRVSSPRELEFLSKPNSSF
ncbi:Uncharacterized conserved protein, DUF924 family [Moraxella cuniculi DSM 21768]|uniref:Uncharacterized conserved protein, DUF924 family n=1 Tax=Moraxella cuniculi DSM 21768 TaxID=1122245 RepID=A0A1N7EI28_9GAMM|nr:Uncharacterized conserved protein, DUF924 family [Moraxella cuniculi DSM 21768]